MKIKISSGYELIKSLQVGDLGIPWRAEIAIIELNMSDYNLESSLVFVLIDEMIR